MYRVHNLQRLTPGDLVAIRHPPFFGVPYIDLAYIAKSIIGSPIFGWPSTGVAERAHRGPNSLRHILETLFPVRVLSGQTLHPNALAARIDSPVVTRNVDDSDNLEVLSRLVHLEQR